MSQVGGRTAATISPAKIDHFRRRARGPPTKIISENFLKKNHQPTHWHRHRPHLPATALLRPPLPPHRRGRSRAAVSPPSAGLHRRRHNHRRVGTVSVVIASTRRGASGRMRAVVITRCDRWRSRRGGKPAEEEESRCRRSLWPAAEGARREAASGGGEEMSLRRRSSRTHRSFSEPPPLVGVDADANADAAVVVVRRGQQRRGRGAEAAGGGGEEGSQQRSRRAVVVAPSGRQRRGRGGTRPAEAVRR